MAIKALITIVTSQTFYCWVREEDKQAAHQPLRRRRTPEQIRALVVRIAHQIGWSYTRVLGELRKLAIRICRSTVVNILQANLVSECVTHYNTVRPHQGKGNQPLINIRRPDKETDGQPLGKIVCDSRLGGLLKHYRHAA